MMVRLSHDVDGCGCLRCQEVDAEVRRRSLAGALSWSCALPLARPSILLILAVVGLIQVLALVVPATVSMGLVFASVLGVFVGRGYLGVVGRERLATRSPGPITALAVVFRRLPAFIGAVTAVIATLAIAGFAVVTLLPRALTWAGDVTGVDPVFVDLATLFVLAVFVVYVLLKCCFVPEACFIGGYGPLASIRVSWTITSLHTTKAALILAGFVGLLAVGVALDTQFAGSSTPVALSFELGETTVVLRSFGLSVGSGFRFTFDLLVTALYSGVFVHQYVASAVASHPS